MARRIRTRLVRIGNSRGVRIPKVVLGQLALSDEVELAIADHHLEIHPARPARAARRGWAEAFGRMAASGDDAPLDPDLPTSWDRTQWEW